MSRDGAVRAGALALLFVLRRRHRRLDRQTCSNGPEVGVAESPYSTTPTGQALVRWCHTTGSVNPALEVATSRAQNRHVRTPCERQHDAGDQTVSRPGRTILT